jgi:hypothetical protein
MRIRIHKTGKRLQSTRYRYLLSRGSISSELLLLWRRLERGVVTGGNLGHLLLLLLLKLLLLQNFTLRCHNLIFSNESQRNQLI